MPIEGLSAPDTKSVELQNLEREVAGQTRSQLEQEFDGVNEIANVLKMEEDDRTRERLSSKRRQTDRQKTDREKEQSDKLVKSVQKTLLAIKSGQVGQRGATPDQTSAGILKALSEKIKIDSIDDKSAPYIYQFLQKGLNNQLNTARQMIEALRSIESLKEINGALYERLIDECVSRAEHLISDKKDEELDQLHALRKRDERLEGKAEEVPMTDEEIEKRKAREKAERNSSRLMQQVEQYYQNPEDKELVEALLDHDDFIKYVLKLRQNNDTPQQLSDALEKKIVGLFSKLFAQVDIQNPDEFWDEAVQANSMYGVQAFYTSLRKNLSTLGDYFESHKSQAEEILGTNPFVKKKNKTEEKQINANTGENKTSTQYLSINPMISNEEIDLTEMVRVLGMTVDMEYTMRSYFHNTSALLAQKAPPAEKGGVYGTLSNYASRLKGADIDEMNQLPDADLVSQTRQLYNKIISKEFANIDWKNNVALFNRNRGSYYNRIQEQVYAAISAMNPKGENNKPRYEEWQLRRAIAIAAGQAKGMTLEEQELVAYADPRMQFDGSGKNYADYYNTAALTPFNAMHEHYRWRSEGAAPLLLYLPLLKDGKMIGIKDHRVVFKAMQEFYDSFQKGNEFFNPGDNKSGDNKDGKKLLIHYLMNPGNMGGFIKRSGWRMQEAYTGYFEDPSLKNGPVNHLMNWKTIENIGYEAMLDYSKYRMNVNINTKKNPGGFVNEEARREFGEYIYKKYIENTTRKPMSYDNYLVHLKEKMDEEHQSHHGHGHGSGEISEEDIFKKLMERATAGAAAQRFGSKFVKMDRNRFNKDGERLWLKIQRDIPWAQAEGASGKFNQYDRAFQNVAIGETMLRAEMTKKMQEAVKAGQTLDTVQFDYRLTQDKLKEYLSSVITGEDKDTQIQQAIDLQRKIEEKCTMDDNFLFDFPKKYFENKNFSFSWGGEELEMSFLNFRAIGPQMLSRSIGDVGKIEANVTGKLYEFFETLRETAVDGKKDTSKLIGLIKNVNDTVRGIHGNEAAMELSSRLSQAVIMYFREDDASQGVKGLTHLSRRNSLAAEYAGDDMSVWAWKKPEIDHFIHELEALRIVDETPYDLSEAPNSTDFYEERKFLGLIKYKTRKEQYHDVGSHALREAFKVTRLDMFKNAAMKALGIMALLALFLTLKKAFDELKSDIGGGGDRH